MTITQPQSSEFNPFYAGYIAKVAADGPVKLLKDQIAVFEKLGALKDADGDHRYAEGKWSVKELVGHVADAERVFSYRLVRIARGDKTPLAGFDENAWAAAAPHATRRLSDVVLELVAIRRSTLALIDSLDEAALANTTLANNASISARALCWIIAGHAQHHLDILRERYRAQI
jgi:uncharacterized damage-inducible protein DinB